MHYQVNSYHVNVGAGDGAIHILSWADHDGQDKRPIVLRAFLVDGGRKEGLPEIETTIWWIEQHYKCYGHNNDLLFDAFIVTHWDGDHYEGVAAYLRKQINASYQEVNGDLNQVIIPRARYADPTDPFNHGQPLSYLYAPHWPTGNEMNDWTRDTGDEEWKQTLKGLFRVGPFGVPRWSFKLLNVRLGHRWLLGRNLFRHDLDDRLMDDKWQHMGSLKKLLNSSIELGNPIQIPFPGLGEGVPWPAMYCIAVNNESFAFNPNHTEKNMSSIALIIVWNDAEDGYAPHISHYFAGDAHDTMEEHLATWLGNCHINSMKLSHHGSSSSNPAQNFCDFSPWNIVVSAGQEYGHPRWEVLFILDAWFAWAQHRCKDWKSLPFFPCQWPAYLVMNDSEKFIQKRFSIRMLDDKHPDHLVGWMDALRDDVYKMRNDDHKPWNPKFPLDKIRTWRCYFKQQMGREPWDEEIRQEVCRLTVDIMQRISILPSNGHNGQVIERAGVGNIGTKEVLIQPVEGMNPGRAFKDLYAVNITSAPYNAAKSGWDYDGRVQIIGRNFLDFDPHGSHIISDDIATTTLAAFQAANYTPHGKARAWKCEEPEPPSLGNDQPRFFDLFMGNPKWLTNNWGHIKSMDPLHGRHQRKGSWFDVEDVSDSNAESSDEDYEDWVPIASSGQPKTATRVAPRPRESLSKELVILRRPISPNIAQPKVYIASESIIGSSRFPPEAKVVPLNKENWLFGLVDTLHLRVFSLAEEPAVNKPARFAPDDEWFHWFSRFFTWNGGKSSDPLLGFDMSMTTNEWEMQKMTRLTFSITAPFVDKRTLVFDTDKGAEHTFSRTSDTGTPVSLVSLTNMLISRRTIVFGLNKLADAFSATLQDVTKFVGVDLNKFPVLKLVTNNGNLPLVLDTDKDFRNALWYRPGMEYATHLRLQFHLETTGLQSWLSVISDKIQVDKMLLIARKKATYGYGAKADVIQSTGSVTCLCSISIPTSNLQFETCISLTEQNLAVTMNVKRPETPTELRAMSGSGGLLKSIGDWLAGVLKLDSLGLKDNLDRATEEDGALSEESILPRRVELVLQLNGNGRITGVESVFIHIEACVKIGKPAVKALEEMPIVFLFTFGWSKTTGIYLRGKLWTVTPPTPFAEYDRALPEFEEYHIIEPLTPVKRDNQLRTINLGRLLSSEEGKLANIPAGIPSEIYDCEIGLSKEQIWFKGAIRCPAPDPDTASKSQPPPIALDYLEVDASYAWGITVPTDPKFRLRLAIAIKLYLGGGIDDKKEIEEQEKAATKLHGELLYDKGTWELTGNANDLNVGHLVCFWHKDEQSSVVQFLSKLVVDYVEVKYQYTNAPNGAASELTFKGKLSIGEVAKLELEYRNKSSKDWDFSAWLGAETPLGAAATIGQVLSSFISDDVLMSLPAAIRGAELKGARGEKPMRLHYASEGGLRVLAIIVNIGNISFWFLQMSQDGGPTKRLIKAMISKISVDVPTFNATFHSPWEQLFLLWVQDTTPVKQDDSANPGITDKEFTNLKTCLTRCAGLGEDDFLLFKPTKMPSEKGDAKSRDDKKSETVLAAAFHLVVVRKNDTKSEVVLDYVFGNKKKAKKQNLLLDPKDYRHSLTDKEKDKEDALDPSGSEKGTKAPFRLKLGPLSIENIGLWYKEDKLGITLDATLLMGPVGLTLIGFSIGVPFNKNSLSEPPAPNDIAWGLQGMMVSLDRPPLTVAGGFIHDTSDPDVDKYVGALIVGFKPWTFQAMGVYATVTKSSLPGVATSTTLVSLDPFSGIDQRTLIDLYEEEKKKETFTFAFILVRLEGPLFSVGFADFAGLVGGFGMNSDILLPTVEQVVNFPFIKERGSDAGKSPVDTMRDLMNDVWFRPAEGLYWAAAGVRITAFQMLAANIVFVVQFGGKSMLIGLYGVATCDVPALEAPFKFAHVELGIVCTFDVDSGFFKVEAQLSPRSFVLAPACHLTGGLALYAWFKGDPKHDIAAGDWVLTIGGFHQAFKAPSQYPRPPRLGISWSLDSSLSVTGEAYFAITPKVCMGGGRLHAALSLGALYAWFDAFVDFLMNFEPFYFQLQARLAVGVRFTLDLWLVTIRINAEVSASLDLSGPPFGGIVHVDFWVFGFDVKFGAPPRAPPPVMLDRFWAVVIKSSGSSSSSLLAAAASDDSPQDTAAIILTCESGLEPPPGTTTKDKDQSTAKWFVKANKFCFLATFQFAITSGSLVEERIEKKEGWETTQTRGAVADIAPQYQEVFSKPMQLVDKLHSHVDILITAPRANALEDDSIHIMKEWKDQKWRITPVITPVPTSVWAKYNRNEDPAVVGNRVQGLLDGDKPTMPLVTGLSVKTPEPTEADDKVNGFDVIKDRMQDVYGYSEKRPIFPESYAHTNGAWLPRGRSRDWVKFKQTWERVGDETSKNVADLWARRLGFDEATVKKDDKEPRKFSPLTGAAPRQLLKRFDKIVPALPLIGVGSRVEM